jgi:hypothetical protein
MFELHRLCKEYNIMPIKKYTLRPKFNINCLNKKNEVGNTPFHIACLHGYIETVKYLSTLEGFNSLNEKNNYGDTSFHLACATRRFDIIKYLITLPNFFSLNEKGHKGYTPFYTVCYNRDKELIKYFMTLKNFTSLNEENNCGETPFYLVCVREDIDIIKEFLKQKNIIIPDNFYKLNYGSKHEIKKLVESYKNDQRFTRMKLILDKNLDIYHLITFLCDDYFELKKKTKNENGMRFMKIARQLPLELQMILIFRLSGLPMNNISGKLFNDNLKGFMTKYMINME